jgi:predicted nucleotidyltransferase
VPDDLIRQCAWPPLAAPFDASLQQATRFVFAEVRPVGVIATGTIVRGEGHAGSDLDLYVVHTADFRRRIQRFFAGVPVEIFINPPNAIRQYFAEEHRDGRLINAHMLATGFVVYSSDPVVEDLRAEARQWLRRPTSLSQEAAIRERYAIAARLEDAADVVRADGPTATMLLTQSVASMLEFFCRSRTGRVPRSKELLASAAVQDAEVGRLAQAFFGASGVLERLQAAEQLADRTIGARGFFEWDSGNQPVGPRPAS